MRNTRQYRELNRVVLTVIPPSNSHPPTRSSAWDCSRPSAAAACSAYNCVADERNSKPASSSASAIERVSISGFSAVTFVLMAVATIFTFVSFDSPFWSQGESGLHDVTVSIGIWQFHEGFNLPSDLGSSLLGIFGSQILSCIFVALSSSHILNFFSQATPAGSPPSKQWPVFASSCISSR